MYELALVAVFASIALIDYFFRLLPDVTLLFFILACGGVAMKRAFDALRRIDGIGASLQFFYALLSGTASFFLSMMGFFLFVLFVEVVDGYGAYVLSHLLYALKFAVYSSAVFSAVIAVFLSIYMWHERI
jgi:hypothetical protein